MRFSRWREFWLLLLVFCILGLGYAVVWQAYLPTWRILYHGADWQIFLPPAVMLVGWLITSIVLTIRRCRETILLPLVSLLIGIGALFLLRLAGGAYTYLGEDNGMRFFGYYNKQLESLALGWVVFLGFLLFWNDYRVIARYKYLIAMTAIGLLLVTTVLGHAVGGQTLTLNLGFISFQPHDPVKLLLVIFMAAYLEEKQELFAFAAGKHGLLTRMDLRYMGPLITLWLMVMAIIFVHDDLGAALLLFGALLAMIYLGTGRKSYVILGVVLSLVGIIGGYQFARWKHLGFVQRLQTRIAIWEDPWQDANNKGYQICQSVIAIGNGRVVGAGLAGGSPERIPAVHTDMIYAAISEDLGLLGAVALLAVFLALIGRMFTIALRSNDRFGKLLAAGLATTLAVQTWVILAGVTKFIPLTGITLPFVSYGGTSIIVNLILVAVVLKVAEEPGSQVHAALDVPGPSIESVL